MLTHFLCLYINSFVNTSVYDIEKPECCPAIVFIFSFDMNVPICLAYYCVYVLPCLWVYVNICIIYRTVLSTCPIFSKFLIFCWRKQYIYIYVLYIYYIYTYISSCYNVYWDITYVFRFCSDSYLIFICSQIVHLFTDLFSKFYLQNIFI